MKAWELEAECIVQKVLAIVMSDEEMRTEALQYHQIYHSSKRWPREASWRFSDVLKRRYPFDFFRSEDIANYDFIADKLGWSDRFGHGKTLVDGLIEVLT